MQGSESQDTMERSAYEAGSLLGLITLDLGFDPIPGMVGHPGSFEFPVLREQLVASDLAARIITYDPDLRDLVLAAATTLVERGADTIATACGYFSVYQQDVEHATARPTMTSPLTTLPALIQQLHAGEQVLVVWAAESPAIAPTIDQLGLGDRADAIVNRSMTPDGAFAKGILHGHPIDTARIDAELSSLVRAALATHSGIAAVLLECGEMPAFASDLRRWCPVRVHDYLEYINQGMARS